MASIVAAMRGVPYSLQAAGATTGNGDVICPPPSFRNHKISIIGTAGIASGAVQPESAADPTYTGTWSQIGGGPVSAVASSTIEFTFQGVFRAIRTRISTNIVGGSVEVQYEGAP